MKASKFILNIFIPVALLSAGCSDCDATRPEPPAPVTFYIVDAQGNNPFAAATADYHPDSLRFTLENEPYTYLFSGMDKGLNNILFETYPVMYDKSKVRLLLHFNQENTDTLDIAYSVTKAQCYTNYSYTSFRYNGRELQPHPETGHLQLSLQQPAPKPLPTALAL
jgi:hypothetical protein